MGGLAAVCWKPAISRRGCPGSQIIEARLSGAFPDSFDKGSISVTNTRPAGPTFLAMRTAIAPLPAPISATVLPDLIASISTISSVIASLFVPHANPKQGDHSAKAVIAASPPIPALHRPHRSERYPTSC